MTPVKLQRLPRRVRAAIEKFESLFAIGIWRDFPHVTQGELRLTFEAGWDPESVSRAFARTLLEHQVEGEVFLTYGDESARHSAGGDHWWVRIVLPDQRELNIDWTARQLYNIEQPHSPQHQDLPCPLVWQAISPASPCTRSPGRTYSSGQNGLASTIRATGWSTRRWREEAGSSATTPYPRPGHPSAHKPSAAAFGTCTALIPSAAESPPLSAAPSLRPRPPSMPNRTGKRSDRPQETFREFPHHA